MQPAFHSEDNADARDAPPLDPPARAAGAVPVEIELKLLVPDSALPMLRQRLQAYGAGRTLQMQSVYFDTPARTLASQRAALRVRRIDEGSDPHGVRTRWVQTLKTGNTDTAMTRRGEWEMPVAGPRLALAALADTPLPQLLGDPAPRLAAVFRTRFARELREVRLGSALIELALDQGHVMSGRRREPLCELELELREGGSAAVYELALALIGSGRDALPLLPCVHSKAARGYRLADRSPPSPSAAGAEEFAAVLRPGMDSQQAARRLVEHGVNRVLANVDGAAAGEDLEFVHQSRVALRRTRSALRLLGVARQPTDPVARDLRWMAERYGDLRDWDVLATHWLPELAGAIDMADHPDWARLMARAERRRRLSRRRLGAALSSARFARVAVRLLQWAHVPAAGAASPRLEGLAPTALQRGHRRILDIGDDLEAMSAQRRHRLRILAKRQRYALELLSTLGGGRAPVRTLKLLSRLQQTLGELNDIQVALTLMPSLTSSREILDRTRRWARRRVRRSLPKAASLLKRLRSRGYRR
jgi:triphosphatase